MLILMTFILVQTSNTKTMQLKLNGFCEEHSRDLSDTSSEKSFVQKKHGPFHVPNIQCSSLETGQWNSRKKTVSETGNWFNLICQHEIDTEKGWKKGLFLVDSVWQLFDWESALSMPGQGMAKRDDFFSKCFWCFSFICCNSLSQWPTFKLLGTTYLVGKIKFKLFFHGPLAKYGNRLKFPPGYGRSCSHVCSNHDSDTAHVKLLFVFWQKRWKDWLFFWGCGILSKYH